MSAAFAAVALVVLPADVSVGRKATARRRCAENGRPVGACRSGATAVRRRTVERCVRPQRHLQLCRTGSIRGHGGKNARALSPLSVYTLKGSLRWFRSRSSGKTILRSLTWHPLFHCHAQQDAARKRRRVSQYPRLYRLHGEMLLPDTELRKDDKQPGMWHLQLLHQTSAAATIQLPRCPVRLPSDFWQMPSLPAQDTAHQQPSQKQASNCGGEQGTQSAQHPSNRHRMLINSERCR